MNKWTVILIILLVVFIVFSIFWERLSLKQIFSDYIQNYKGGTKNDGKSKKRKKSLGAILVLGILPYLIGVAFFLAFESIVICFDLDFLLQVNIIILTILCLFYGVNGSYNNRQIFKETSAVILVDILLILLNSFIMMFANSFCYNTIVAKVLFGSFWAIEFKILVAFLYVVRRINIIKSESTLNDKED